MVNYDGKNLQFAEQQQTLQHNLNQNPDTRFRNDQKGGSQHNQNNGGSSTHSTNFYS